MRGSKAEKDERGLPKWKGVKEVAWHKHKNMALRLVKLPCNKDNCAKCPHGPYWYLVTWHGKRATQRYIGKKLFGERVKGRPDLETLIVKVLRKTGYRPPAAEFDYVPEGFVAKGKLARSS
jgi:hypothetical protein